MDMNRRQLLSAAARLPALLLAARGMWLSGAAEASTGSALTPHEAGTLLRVAWLLFPFDGLGQEPYARVVGAMAARGEQRPLIRKGVEALDRLAGGRFLDLPEARQVELLGEIESGDFFSNALEGTRGTLFRDPELWALIGYEGSSLEFGGYLNRGLEDIDWLPDFDDGDVNPDE